MNVGSTFSGVGGLDLGLERAGHRVLWQCESDPYRRAVLAARFPGTHCYEDMAALIFPARPGRVGAGAGAVGAGLGDGSADGSGYELPGKSVDLLAGGFPCQDLSVAGRRAGLVGKRSGLFHEFARIADELRPAWILLENVPGLLSSHQGRDFATIIDTLDGLGYVGAWRILDSRFFGVPQRRRRVFIVAARADVDPGGERCGEVLAVGARCERHPPTGRASGPKSAVASLSGLGSGGPDDNDGQGGRLVAAPLSHVADALAGRSASRLDDACVRGGQLVVAAPPPHGSNPNSNMAGRRREDDENLISFDAEFSNQDRPADVAILTRKLRRAVSSPQTGVRRLTPRECERLQAFPDDFTLVEWRGKPAADSPRYAAVGDAVTVNVAEWIGRRLEAVGR